MHRISLGNITLLLLSVLVAAVLAEIAGRVAVSSYSSNYLDKASYVFYQENMATTHHLRDVIFLDLLKLEPSEDNNHHFLYSQLTDGETEVLIQGDSWAEQFLLSSGSSAKLSELGEDFGIYVAGTTSYSPSLMAAQYDLLTEKFELDPTLVVAVIDQTDVVDEVCRYARNRTVDSDGRVSVSPYDETVHPDEIYKMDRYFQYGEILYSERFALIKLLKYAWYRYWHYPRMNIDSNGPCAVSDIQGALKGELTGRELRYFEETVLAYINRIFSSGSVERLMVLTHFHRGHLSDEYTVDVGELVKHAFSETQYGNRIDLYNITPGKYLDGFKLEMFRERDPASHLTNEAHAGVYTDTVMAWLRSYQRK